MMRLQFVLPLLSIVCSIGLLSAAHAQSGSAAGAVQPAPVADRAAELEERLIDLQVRVATLRSLSANVAPVATGVAAQSSLAGESAAGSRQALAALEGEMSAVATELRQLSGKPALIIPGGTVARVPATDNRLQNIGAAPVAPQGTASGWSGTTTVSPNGGLLPGQAGGPAAGQSGQGPVGEIRPGAVYPGYQQEVPRFPGAAAPQQPAAPQGDAVAGWARPEPLIGAAPQAPPATGNAETEYQTAYGYLLQQDYGAAQTAFNEFLARYPNTALAGNAQYWIGETHYVRGAYKNAAMAFLRGYEKYGDGNKGPDSLLKLGLSLGKLRQNAAACSSLRELGKRYSDAPEGLLARANAEISRLRCPN